MKEITLLTRIEQKYYYFEVSIIHKAQLWNRNYHSNKSTHQCVNAFQTVTPQLLFIYAYI